VRVRPNFKLQLLLSKVAVIASKTPILIFMYLIVGTLALVMADDYSTERNNSDNYDQQSTALHLLAKTSTDPELPVINDLTNGEVSLHWTAPGDDGNIGQAAGYDIRYWPVRFGPINSEHKWISANRVPGEPSPSPAGLTDSMLVTSLESGAEYYFCIKAYDEVGNYSGLSNSPLVTASNMGYVISIDTSGRGGVSVQPDQECYQDGETVTLTALPSEYWEFDSWGGDIESNSNPVSFIMTGDIYINATFTTDYIPGDANGDGQLLSSDLTYLIDYFAGQLPAPVPFLAGDANGDCNITGNDLIFILNYFRGIGPLPARGDCDNIFIFLDDQSTTH